MSIDLPEALRPKAPSAPKPAAPKPSGFGRHVVNGVLVVLLLSKVVGLGLAAASRAHAAHPAPAVVVAPPDTGEAVVPPALR